MKWAGNQKAFNLTRIAVWWWAVCWLVAPARTPAFALLGPVQPWMQKTDCVLWPDDIGGPMELGSEYRWNVPVVTYGFDQSFLDYFGTNGVAAVESAIKILNDLPPASSLELTNYPLNSLHHNASPEAQPLYDLKSQTLSRLVEQLGLASPTRYVYVLHDWYPAMFNEASGDLAFFEIPIYYEQDPSHIDPLCWSYDQPGNLFFCIAGLNFSPETLETSVFVNDTAYMGNVSVSDGWPKYIASYPVDSLANWNNAVADNQVYDGQFYSGLSRDDVGGLRYLLLATNLNYEMLLFDVQGVNGQKFVNYAWRPGVEKITFVPQPKGALPGTFLPITNLFTDTYMVGRDVRHQQLQRVTSQPDFLFSVGNDWARTGTWNWDNLAALNNNIAGTGPGIIEPPVVITFPKMGSNYNSETEDSVVEMTVLWGSFDGSTNAPIVYPVAQTGTVSGAVRMSLNKSRYQEAFHNFEWTLTSPFGMVYAFQTSTNLTTWSTLFMVTNNGSVCTFLNGHANSRARFYRVVPE